MPNAKLWKFCIVATVIACVFATVYFTNKTRNSTPTDHITAILPLTGPAAAFGAEEKLGIELALEQSGISTLKVDFQDSQGKPDVAVSILQQSYDLKDSRIFICSTTGPSAAVLPILRDKADGNLSFIMATLSDMTVGFPNAFRVYPSVTEELRVLNDHAMRSGFLRIAALCVRNQAGEDAIARMKTAVESRQGTVILSETFLPTDKDFRNVLEKIRQSKPDAILVTGYSFNYVDIFKQMSELGVDSPILAGVGTPLANLPEQLPSEFLLRVVFPASKFSFDKSDPKVIEFLNLVKAKGQSATYETAFAYDTMQMITRQYRPSQSTSELKTAIIKNMPFEGVNGSIRLNEHGDAHLQLVPCHYINGEIARVESDK